MYYILRTPLSRYEPASLDGGNEKREWLNQQTTGNKKMEWIVGTIIGLVVAAAVAGVLLVEF